MNRLSLWALLTALLAGMTVTGCDSSENYNYELSRDCLVSAVTLGTLNRTVHYVNEQGNDTSYVVTVTGSMYPIYIDQVNNRIYNADSLPVGTDVTKVVFSTFSASGTMAVKSITTGKDTLFTAKDSTDFSLERLLTVYSADNSASRTYTVDIRAHHEEADTFVWQHIAESAPHITAFSEMSALCPENTLYLFGRTADGRVQLITSPARTPDFSRADNVTSATGVLPDVNTVRFFRGAFYAIGGGRLLTAGTDATAWHAANAGVPALDALIGAGTDSLYAIGGTTVYASADGTEWTPCAVENAPQLPDARVAAARQGARRGLDMESIVMTGTKDGQACVWKHDIDLRGDYSFPWTLLPQTTELGSFGCPVLEQPSLVVYDDALVLTGLTADRSVSPFYVSRDFGRTWDPDRIAHPGMTGAGALAVVTDADHYIWLICGGTGEVYKGRINRLGWQDNPTRFEKSRRR